MQTSPLGFLGVKAIALPVFDLERAHKFYRDTLSLMPAREGGREYGVPDIEGHHISMTPTHEGGNEAGYYLGQTILMLKDGWYARPTDMPNPRVTIDVRNAPHTEKALRGRGVVISDPVQIYDDFYVGGFLDSEGNKLWFCSPVHQEGA